MHCITDIYLCGNLKKFKESDLKRSKKISSLFSVRTSDARTSKTALVNFLWEIYLWNSRPEVFCKKVILKNFAKFTGKHLCQSHFFNKVAGLRPVKKETLALVFSCEFCEISRNTFSHTTPPMAASASVKWQFIAIEFLTHFMPLASFYTSRKSQKAQGVRN